MGKGLYDLIAQLDQWHKDLTDAEYTDELNDYVLTFLNSKPAVPASKETQMRFEDAVKSLTQEYFRALQPFSQVYPELEEQVRNCYATFHKIPAAARLPIRRHLQETSTLLRQIRLFVAQCATAEDLVLAQQQLADIRSEDSEEEAEQYIHEVQRVFGIMRSTVLTTIPLDEAGNLSPVFLSRFMKQVFGSKEEFLRAHTRSYEHILRAEVKLAAALGAQPRIWWERTALDRSYGHILTPVRHRVHGIVYRSVFTPWYASQN